MTDCYMQHSRTTQINATEHGKFSDLELCHFFWSINVGFDDSGSCCARCECLIA